MSNLNVRYIVEDVEEAIEFYQRCLGFELIAHPAPGFAALLNGDLRLLITRPGAGGAGIAGGSPQPGGWNRFQIEVDDIDETVQKLRAMGASFRGDVVQGRGGRQVLVEDPSGNAVELFQPAL